MGPLDLLWIKKLICNYLTFDALLDPWTPVAANDPGVFTAVVTISVLLVPCEVPDTSL